MAELCLTLLCPRGTEEKMLDTLLEFEETTILTSAGKTVHGLHPRDLDSAEQVLGGARSTEIQVLLERGASATILDELRKRFKGSGVRYWTSPIEAAGELS